MKETIKTSRTAGYLEKMFRTLNADYYAGEIEEPIITIQSTPGAYGHVTCSKVWKRKGEERHELNIGADTLERPIEEVVGTILHEMAHLWNMQNGIKDCSRGNTYHNKRFKATAEAHGLSIGHHDRYGWTITTVTDETLEYIINQGWADIQMNRGMQFRVRTGGGSSNKGGDIEPKKTSTRKYICPRCGNSVRATKEVNIMCMDCMMQMVKI